MEITQALLKELFDYDTEQGLFINKVVRARRLKPGQIAGTVQGYSGEKRRIMQIDNRRIMNSHLVWLYHTGTLPKNQIDHIDGNPLNDRIENLREATQSENNQNMRKHKDGKTPYIGVIHYPNRKGKKYLAQISFRNLKHHLGYFDTPEEAHAAYCAAKRQLHTFNPEVRAA